MNSLKIISEKIKFKKFQTFLEKKAIKKTKYF
jgi:hypothetical protein